MSNLITMAPVEIMRDWKPDRHPRSEPWTWEQAIEHAFIHDTARTLSVVWAFKSLGRYFADEHAPIMLGASGYVIDGHHRIIVAHALLIPTLRVAR